MVVALVPLDEPVLSSLLRVATEEATADEVTPPLTAGPDWTEVRRQWFLDFHRARRDQLHAPVAESTWAVVLDGRPVGAVRLKRAPDASTLETGIWLARSVRGQGVGTAALEAIAGTARAAGARTVVADTAAGNLAAQAAMRRAGFRLAPVDSDGRVRGSLMVEETVG
jgi:RimJ/RimL family protein N-acetyltransferase